MYIGILARDDHENTKEVFLMENTKLLLALRGLEPTPVWIASTVLKNKDRKDIREFFAKDVDEGDTVRIVLEETVREPRDTHNFFHRRRKRAPHQGCVL